jgi:membrane-associated phospholipid phosphatase
VRPHERLLIVYFAYVALITPFFIVAPWKPLGILAVATLIILALQKTHSEVRDWLALALVLTAYREMDLFTPVTPALHFEPAWLAIDHTVLADWHLRAAIESLGWLIPSCLELAYLLVYSTGLIGLGFLRLYGKRERSPEFLFYYVAGAVFSYALFPYFPSQPPRTLFPDADPPQILTALRSLNLRVLGDFGIHSSVFPSAHVSSALGAAIGLLATIPEKPWVGWGMCAYSLTVAVATVYGRYHYTVDSLAGIGISLIAGAVGRYVFHRWKPGGAA